MSATYLTTEQLSERIHYDVRTIRDRLKDSVLFEGIHYIRPFGGRKLLFIKEAIERDIGKFSASKAPGPMVAHTRASSAGIPMANGGLVHG